MADFDNTNRGVLFINNNKKSDKSPTMMGKINVNGQEYYLSAWTNYKKSDGEKYLSMSVRPVEDDMQQPNKPKPNDNLEDDIPF